MSPAATPAARLSRHDDPRHPSRAVDPSGGPGGGRRLLDRWQTPGISTASRSSSGCAMRTATSAGSRCRARDLSDDAEIAGLVVNAREITDRKAAEQLLATSEARFRALVQHSSDVVAVVDRDGRFTFVSPAITRMLGHLAGGSGRHPGGRPAAATTSWSACSSPRATSWIATCRPIRSPPPSMEVRLRGRDGDWHTVDITITDLRHEPAVGGIVLNARDVTVRKALEHDLRHQALHDAPHRPGQPGHVHRAGDRDVADRRRATSHRHPVHRHRRLQDGQRQPRPRGGRRTARRRGRTAADLPAPGRRGGPARR